MNARTTPSRPGRSPRAIRREPAGRRQPRRAIPATALALACTALVTGGTTAPAAAAESYSDLQPAYQNLGTWVPLDMSGNAQGNTPAVFETSGADAYDLWLDKIHGLYTYEVAELGPDGGVLAPAASIFGSHYWDGLSSQTTLVANGPNPLVIFDGGLNTNISSPYNRGCVVGALGPKIPWALQSWSLSNDCYNPTPESTETSTGELSAAWGGSVNTKQAVIYHLGAGATIPAKAPDSYTLTPGGGIAYASNEAADVAGNDHVYVSWAESFAKNNAFNGYYAKDVTSNGPSMRAPGSGANSAGDLPPDGAKIAMASTNTHGGVFLLYCGNAPGCTYLLLWRVGASKAMVVPGAVDAFHYALSAGPDGRLWLAWYNHSNNDVSTVRTNEADNAFGPVRTYTTPCFEDGLLGLSGGSWGRLDVAMECVDNKTLKLVELETQSLASLAISPSSMTVSNATANTITFHVTDAGDPVAGATVHLLGFASPKTDASGKVTFSLPKGYEGTGATLTVGADATNYIPTAATLKVTSPPPTTT